MASRNSSCVKSLRAPSVDSNQNVVDSENEENQNSINQKPELNKIGPVSLFESRLLPNSASSPTMMGNNFFLKHSRDSALLNAVGQSVQAPPPRGSSSALEVSDACTHNLSSVLNPLDSNMDSIIIQPIEQIEDTLEDEIQKDSFVSKMAAENNNPLEEDEINQKWFANGFSLEVKKQRDGSQLV